MSKWTRASDKDLVDIFSLMEVVPLQRVRWPTGDSGTHAWLPRANDWMRRGSAQVLDWLPASREALEEASVSGEARGPDAGTCPGAGSVEYCTSPATAMTGPPIHAWSPVQQ